MTVAREPTAEVLRRVEKERIAWLCCLRRDGSPHVTPIWFVFRDRTWWIGSGERNRKIGNLEHDARVSIALEGGLDPVVAEGTAVVHRAGFPPDLVAAFAAKYDGWDVTAEWTGEGARVLVEVPVRRWLLAGVAQ